MKEFGAEIQVLSDDDWWQIIVNSHHPNDSSFYVDAVRSNGNSRPQSWPSDYG